MNGRYWYRWGGTFVIVFNLWWAAILTQFLQWWSLYEMKLSSLSGLKLSERLKPGRGCMFFLFNEKCRLFPLFTTCQLSRGHQTCFTFWEETLALTTRSLPTCWPEFGSIISSSLSEAIRNVRSPQVCKVSRRDRHEDHNSSWLAVRSGLDQTLSLTSNQANASPRQN